MNIFYPNKSENSQALQNHRLLKTGFRKLREQHLESTAAATALEERLSTLHENHAQLTIKSQDMERQILRAEQLSQAYEARAQTAEQRVEEAGVRLEESEHWVREVEARLEELERQFHNAEPQTTNTTILVSHNVCLPPPYVNLPHILPPASGRISQKSQMWDLP